jgi:hypothetical protein
MRVDALEQAIAADRAAGLLPFLVASAAGTTSTGAVDPLDSLADVCAREGLWHHVDGAYGAFFHACPELRPLLAGLPRADSVTLDPHKGLFLPYGTGALLVRDGAALRKVHSAAAAYFPDRADDDVYDPSLYGPDLSRAFRAGRAKKRTPPPASFCAAWRPVGGSTSPAARTRDASWRASASSASAPERPGWMPAATTSGALEDVVGRR